MGSSRLYTTHAEWWSLLSPATGYGEEAALISQLLLSKGQGVTTVLELGAGGGNNAFHLKRGFEMTLSDLSPDMIAASQKLNPDLEHVQGDMRSVRLGRTYDAVLIHDAIMYMLTEDDLRRALETANVHLGSEGVLLVIPDCFQETFSPGTKHGGTDVGGRGMRYLQWTHDPDPRDQTYIVDFALVFGDEDGGVTVDHDRHVFGLFSEETWLRLLDECGFDGEVVPMEHSGLGPGSWNALVGLKR